jgi:hypothetical protein
MHCVKKHKSPTHKIIGFQCRPVRILHIVRRRPAHARTVRLVMQEPSPYARSRTVRLVMQEPSPCARSRTVRSLAVDHSCLHREYRRRFLS